MTVFLNPPMLAACIGLLLVASAFLGWWMQKRLPTHHRSRDTVDAVRLVMTMLLTLSAVVLGLLTSSAKARYDEQVANVEKFAVDLIELDARLRQYGIEVAPARELLRGYTAAALASTWPDEPAPAGFYPRPRDAQGPESFDLGDMLTRLDRMIETLAPPDPFHAQIAARLRARVADILQQRWRLLSSLHTTLSWPFLTVLTMWLVVIFAIFGLSSPHNTLLYTVIVLGALSMSSSLYLILDFDAPRDGLLRLSSRPMRDALVHMDRPVSD